MCLYSKQICRNQRVTVTLDGEQQMEAFQIHCRKMHLNKQFGYVKDKIMMH